MTMDPIQIQGESNERDTVHILIHSGERSGHTFVYRDDSGTECEESLRDGSVETIMNYELVFVYEDDASTRRLDSAPSTCLSVTKLSIGLPQSDSRTSLAIVIR
ncbi:hypothetical protein C480_19594 [Natrialba aegyptia DSM 13077]|uniref:Uncharacterized protein n=2 Tax=Halobacteriales TaxID=2235 RepID=M0AMR7_9EURY|nr:hypothetical protein C480_19594 [Natrialba aegyptia DSM 13077]